MIVTIYNAFFSQTGQRPISNAGDEFKSVKDIKIQDNIGTKRKI